MRSFFNSENWFWQGFGRLADYFILSILWLLCSLPVVTLGTASIALYDTVAHCLRSKEGNMVKRFFSTFKRELGRGILLTILWALICFFLNMAYQILCQLGQSSSGWNIFSIVYFVTLLIPLGIICWLVAIESRFTHTFGSLHRVALTFTFGYLPSTLAIVALLVLEINILMNFFFFAMILPAVIVHLQSFFIERVFRRYMPETETV